MGDADGGILSVSPALTNGLMLAALAGLLSRRARVPRWAAWVMVGAALLNSLWAWWPFDDPVPLAGGYWLWETSFCLVAILLLRRRRRVAPLPAV